MMEEMKTKKKNEELRERIERGGRMRQVEKERSQVEENEDGRREEKKKKEEEMDGGEAMTADGGKWTKRKKRR